MAVSPSLPLQILQKHWGYPAFRPLQEDIIRSVIEGNDTLALLPTGGGKSICFQVPALALEGLCVVVSPLIALMKDQVEQLQRRGIAAQAIYSGMSQREIDILLDNCIYGNIKFLYLSPERLQTKIFLERVGRMKIGLLAVDEAHCISQWGYDFRPPYLEIAQFRQQIPGVACIALTASATEIVQKDICEKLDFQEAAVFKKSFARGNLSYSTFKLEYKEAKMLEILKNVPGTSIVYVRNRKRTKQFADLLRQQGISADHYHAGLSAKERDRKQSDWIENRTRVIVSTNAFGMGIDKPDVRSVIHMDLPPDLESYYQEAGRGGRDEKMAYAVLLFNQEDIDQLLRQIERAYPSVEDIKKTYQALANYYKIAVGSGEMATFPFDLEEFTERFALSSMTAFFSLKKLEETGFLLMNEGFYQPSKLFFIASPEDLYKFQVANGHFDLLIKVLLRTYGGELYTQFVNISEKQLATNLNLPEQKVRKELKELQDMEIALYEPRREKPHLTFVRPRLSPDQLKIDAKAMQARKQHDWEKAQSVITFVQNAEQCRTQQILAYFGEWSDERCGVCDVCLREKKAAKKAQTSVQSVKQHLLAWLKDAPQSWEELRRQHRPSHAAHYQQTIREMLDHGLLELREDGKLAVKER